MSQGRRRVMIKVAALSLFQSTYRLQGGFKYRVLSVLCSGEHPSEYEDRGKKKLRATLQVTLKLFIYHQW